MQRARNEVRSSGAKVSLLLVPYFLLCLLYEGDYFARKEALVQLCVGCVSRYKSRISDLNKNSIYCCMPHS